MRGQGRTNNMLGVKVIEIDLKKITKDVKVKDIVDLLIKKSDEACCEKRCDGEVEKTMPCKDLTFGDKMVGLDFNPGKNENVATVKGYYAAIIDLLNDFRLTVEDENVLGMLDIAIKEAMTAQMWAVKAITFK